MQNIKSLNLFELLKECAEIKQKPILGICLGMQLIARYSEEGDETGFGWINSNVVKFSVSDHIKYKVPHMGWNTLAFNSKNILFNNIPKESEFYFVHSYHLSNTQDDQILATTVFDYEFVSAVQNENIVGYQFHPEKSHSIGLQLLKNFLNSNYV